MREWAMAASKYINTMRVPLRLCTYLREKMSTEEFSWVREACRDFHNKEQFQDLLHQLGSEKIDLHKRMEEIERRIEEIDITIPIIEVVQMVRESWKRVPLNIQLPFYNASRLPETLFDDRPFAQRMELLLQQNKNNGNGHLIDMIDVVHIIEVIDTFRINERFTSDYDLRLRIAGVLPEIIRNNTDKLPDGNRMLNSKVDVIDYNELERVLTSVNLVREQLNRLPLAARLVLPDADGGNPESTMHRFLRSIIISMLLEKSLGLPRPKPTGDVLLVFVLP